MSGQYLSMDVDDCRRAGHRFTVAGSDKTPLKKNLICRTCTERNPGKTAYVAYGIDTGSWGEWRHHSSRLPEAPVETEVE